MVSESKIVPPHPEMCLVSQQYFYFSLNLESTLLGWPNGSGGSLQSCYMWVQFPSPAYFPKQTFTFLMLADKGNGGSVLI
jgi:hypothetical protein